MGSSACLQRVVRCKSLWFMSHDDSMTCSALPVLFKSPYADAHLQLLEIHVLLFALLPPLSNRTSLYRTPLLLVAAAAMVCRLCGQAGHSVRTCKLPGAQKRRALPQTLKVLQKQEGRRPPRFGGMSSKVHRQEATPRSSTLVPAGVSRKASCSELVSRRRTRVLVFQFSPQAFFCFLSFHDAGWSLRNGPPGRCAEAARRGLPPQPFPLPNV